MSPRRPCMIRCEERQLYNIEHGMAQYFGAIRGIKCTVYEWLCFSLQKQMGIL